MTKRNMPEAFEEYDVTWFLSKENTILWQLHKRFTVSNTGQTRTNTSGNDTKFQQSKLSRFFVIFFLESESELLGILSSCQIFGRFYQSSLS